jgi:hypothetical protein
MSKEILIARPNAFIVKNMKGILDDCGKNPIVLADIEEMEKHKDANLCGVVISTAVTSSIAGSFEEVLSKVLTHFRDIPILLPTMLDLEKAKSSIYLTLSRIGVSHELVSVEEASKRAVINSANTMIILKKEDMTESEIYGQSISVIKKFLK